MHRTIASRQPRSIDDFIILLILAKEFILDYLGLGTVVNLIICGLIIVRVINVQWRIPLFIYVAIAMFPCMAIGAVLMEGDLGIAIINLARLFQVGLYVLFFVFLRIKQPDHLRELYERGFAFFNAMLIVNMIIIVIQYLYPGLLVAASNSNEVMGVDVMSGLFGAASTHSVALYTTFVIVYDIGMVQKRTIDNRVFIIYIVVTALLSLFIATLNDNKALFFFLPLGVLLCWIIYIAFHNKVAIAKTLLIVPILACALLVMYLGIPAVQSFVQNNIARSIDAVVNAFDLSGYVNGSDERFHVISYALSLSSTWGFGDGLGQVDLYQKGYRGFNHFGQSDFCSIVILGGIWLYILILYFYTKAFTTFSSQVKPKKAVLFGVTFALLVTSSIFTQVFTQVRIAIPLVLVSYALSIYWQCFAEQMKKDDEPKSDSLMVEACTRTAGLGESNRESL